MRRGISRIGIITVVDSADTKRYTVHKSEGSSHGKRYFLRTPLKGVCGKVLQGAGVAIPPPVRSVGEEKLCGAKAPSPAL